MKTKKEIAEYYYSVHCDNTMDKEKYWIIPAMIGAMEEYANSIKEEYKKWYLENITAR